jgi:hypothetical protein
MFYFLYKMKMLLEGRVYFLPFCRMMDTKCLILSGRTNPSPDHLFLKWCFWEGERIKLKIASDDVNVQKRIASR